VTFFAVVLDGLLMQLDVDPRASKRPLRDGRISGPCFARSSGLVILAHFGYAASQLSIFAAFNFKASAWCRGNTMIRDG